MEAKLLSGQDQFIILIQYDCVVYLNTLIYLAAF